MTEGERVARHTARDLRGENRFAVLHALFDLGPSSRQELARHTGLSQATVTTLVGEFLAQGVLVIAARERGGVGRPYERLAIDPDRGRIVGVDVAETYVDATVYDLTLGVLGQGEVALDEHENGQGYVVDGIVAAIGRAVEAGGVARERIVGVGVSMPGHVHPGAGVSVFAPNWAWHDVRIEELLAARLELPVHVDNPLKAVALSEMWFGVGRSVDSMAVLALMVMLCEGAANDWSALHLKDVMGASAGVAAFAYGTFAAAMTVGRLLADRIAARFGSLAIVRHGAALAALGITLVALGPGLWAVFTGWALFGLGLSGCVPQLFSAAGHADPTTAGANVSRVAGLGYVGMLAGPAVIGWLAHLVALDHAFVLLTLLCVTTAAGAGVLRTTPSVVRRGGPAADRTRQAETTAGHH
nr:ROK family protein [Streptomyces sp. ST1020]